MASIPYNKINWQNEPNHTTPLSAENLNKMDTAIYDLVTKSNSLVPNPAESPTEGLEKLEYDGTVYEVKGGHKILNDSGSVLTQMDNMQFNGVYTHNASTITEVDIVREFSTVAEIEALTGEAQKGFQARINGNSYEPFKATDIGFNKTGTSFTSDDVDGVLREVNSALDSINNSLIGTEIRSGYMGDNTTKRIARNTGLLYFYRASTSLFAIVSVYATNVQTVAGTLPNTITITPHAGQNPEDSYVDISNGVGYTIGVTAIMSTWNAL